MPKFLMTLAVEFPAKDGESAITNVVEFFERLTVEGQAIPFVLEDVKIKEPATPQED